MATFLGYFTPNSKGNADDRDTYFSKSGGTMSGDIDLDGNGIMGISDTPATNSSIFNKK